MLELSLIKPETVVPAADFLKSIIGLNVQKREEAFFHVLVSGHVPDHVRNFVDVVTQFFDAKGEEHSLTLRVLPDYLMIGDNVDNFRVPLWPTTAQKIADAWNCVLPTTKLVTMIWHSAKTKVSPQPWGPPYDASMMSTDRIVRHNSRINATIRAMNVSGDLGLVAGHKKDVVMTNQLVKKPKQVSIFGWHQSNGKPIQPLYLGHEREYSDYSHSIRLISFECLLDGCPEDLRTIMQDPVLSVAVSSEGPLQLLRYPGV